jgi:hypothetical protein
MPFVKQVWTEDGLRKQAQDMGYWIVKIIAHANDYWYLIKTRSPKVPIFVGQPGRDFINLGPLGSPDAVFAVIQLLKSQRAAAEEETSEAEVKAAVREQAEIEASVKAVRKFGVVLSPEPQSPFARRIYSHLERERAEVEGNGQE